MFFSLTPSAFRTPQICTLDNGTEIYYGLDSLSCSCLAPIRADPDFAGAGVISAFIATCWITIIVAAIPTGYGLWVSWTRTEGPYRFWKWIWRNLQFETVEQADARRRSASIATPRRPVLRDSVVTTSDSDSDGILKGGQPQRPSMPSARQPSGIRMPRVREPAYCKWARRIVLQLCDVQIITGIAILVSALAQYHRLTFYHAQFAVQHWWMTLNSFWISRIDYSRNTPEMRTARATVRRWCVWISVALSLAMQAIVAYREKEQWNITEPGKCYVSDDAGTSFGQNIFWLAGSVLYFSVLTVSLVTPSRKWFDENVNAKIVPSIKLTESWVKESWRDTRISNEAGIFPPIINYLRTFFYAVVWLTWYLLCLFLSVWCAGNSAALFELGLYSVFAGFLTWWVVFLKVQNKPLIRGDEDRFTLGQTLPLLLLVLVCIHAVDVWAGVVEEEKKVKRQSIPNTNGRVVPDEETGGNEDENVASTALASGMAVTRPMEPGTPALEQSDPLFSSANEKELHKRIGKSEVS